MVKVWQFTAIFHWKNAHSFAAELLGYVDEEVRISFPCIVVNLFQEVLLHTIKQFLIAYTPLQGSKRGIPGVGVCVEPKAVYG